MHQIRFSLGGLPNTQAVRQPTSKGREELEGGKEEGRGEGNGKGRNKGEGICRAKAKLFLTSVEIGMSGERIFCHFR